VFFLHFENNFTYNEATTKNSEDKTRLLYHSLKHELSIIHESKSENGWRKMQKGHTIINEGGS